VPLSPGDDFGLFCYAVGYRDDDGLAVWAKQLERGTFCILDTRDDRLEMTADDLPALLAAPPQNSRKNAITSNTRIRSRRMIIPVYPLPGGLDSPRSLSHQAYHLRKVVDRVGVVRLVRL
jgi:hypothetical protein